SRQAFEAASAINSAMDSAYRRLVWLLITCAAIGIVVSLAIAIWVIRNAFLKPLGATLRTMEVLSQRKLDTEVPYQGRPDEIGEIAKAVE
ncbi:HAMP domain-containing protein, partial [Klebsiella pneumoniae]|uniref:HAMP domain-containing protein n=1 Tax=Klebsiella pneumoniae TaxID=573 RepID=UPI003CEAA85F